ncbi:hypothetical protein ACJDU8_15745 [Clostridium sp. WILCCON 0269]|uniref:S-layer protein SbsC C-terminal domain-containing protein n=1 Tax=Candidatus Clostridium eludens TaxID=3381663 RepID=A0ABW8SM12_9CLOT
MTDTTVTEELLPIVKSYLRITWQDENTDNNLKGFINRGIARLTDIAGVPSLDFTTEGQPKTLLLDYCRYANSQALEMFEKNFVSELLDLSLQHQFEVPRRLTVISTVGTSTGYTRISVSPQLDEDNSYAYKLGTELSLPGYFDVCDSTNGYTKWNGIAEIAAMAGNDIIVVEIDKNNKAIRAGKITVTVG